MPEPYTSDLRANALEAAINGWEVGPLCKVDETGRRHPHGKDPVTGLTPRGFYDFTTDVATVDRWWSDTQWNIGVRVPESMFVLDADGPDRRPHPGTGMEVLAQLEDRYGKLPETFTQFTGSGGLHLFFRRPPGRLTAKYLPKGLEYKARGGYVVWAPSVHPDSGRKYVRCDRPVAAPPQWLIDLIVAPPPPARRRTSTRLRRYGPSIADDFSHHTSWADVLEPHGWTPAPGSGDPDGEGARWLHPTATSSCSATVRNGCLFVYSPNTPFDVTEGGNPEGYTRFRAYAVLNHAGDMKAAARALGGAR